MGRDQPRRNEIHQRTAIACTLWALSWAFIGLFLVFQIWPTLENLQARAAATSTTISAPASGGPTAAATATNPAPSVTVTRPATSAAPRPSATASAGASTKAASSTGAAGATTGPPQAQLPVLWWHQQSSLDSGLIVLAFAFGALAAAAHSLYVLTAAIPAGDFGTRRLGWFVPQPLLGGILAILFYVVVRAGLVSSESGTASINLFGTAGLSALAGLSAHATYKKLSQVFGGSTTPSPAPAAKLAVTRVEPSTVSRTSPPATLTVHGSLLDKATFAINDTTVTATARTASSATLPLAAEAVASGAVKIRVSSAGQPAVDVTLPVGP